MKYRGLNYFYVITIFISLSLFQCKGDDSNSDNPVSIPPDISEGSNTGATVYSTEAELPGCDIEKEGFLYYILESNTFKYCDGGSYQLIELSSAQSGVSMTWKGSLTEAPLDPQVNWAYYNSTDGKSYIWDGTEWQILCQDGQDGQAAGSGTDPIYNVSPGSGSDYLRDFQNPIEFSGKLYFLGRSTTGTNKIYIYDGNSISNVNVGTSDYSFYFSNPIIFNAKLYFSGKNSSGKELMFEFNGSVINNLSLGASDFEQIGEDRIVFSSDLFFGGHPTGNATSTKVYQFDNTQVSNTNEGVTSDYKNGFSSPIIYNAKLYFRGLSNTGISKVYVYDGTEIKNLSTGASDYYQEFQSPVVFNSKLYFGAMNNFAKPKVYEYDDTQINNVNIGTSDYSEICYGLSGFSNPIILNSKLYFQGNYINPSGTCVGMIFEFDGATINNVPKGNSDYVAAFMNPVIYNTNLYFQGSSDFLSSQLLIYEFNGTQIVNVVQAGDSLYERGFMNPIIFNSRLYFSDGASLSLVHYYDAVSLKTYSESASDFVGQFNNPIVFNGRLYFRGKDKYSLSKFYVHY